MLEFEQTSNQIPETKMTIPYLAIILFCLILLIRGIEYLKTGKQSLQDYKKYHPYVVQWLIKYNLGFLVPFMNLIGVSQLTAPNLYTGGIVVIVLSIIILLFLLIITEVKYGHQGFILLFLASAMTGPFLDSLQTFTCLDGENIDMNKNFCCGTILIVFLAAACVNIFSTGGVFGIILGCVLHLLFITGLTTLDYFKTFKKIKNYRLCLSGMHHTMGYVIGFIISLLIIVLTGNSDS